MNNKYLDLMEEIKNDIEYDALDLATSLCDFNGGYIGDIVHEIADSGVDVYTYNLFEWGKTHTYEIEESMKEFGSCESITQILMSAQYWANCQLIWDNLENALKLWALDYLRTNDIELNYEKLDEIMEEIESNYSRYDKLEEIENLIKGDEEQC